MVEPDLAELVNDDRRLRECRILQQAVEQRGLAGAQKAREHGKWNGRWGRLSLSARRGLAHCVDEVTFGLACFAGFAALAGFASSVFLAFSAAAPLAGFSAPSALAAVFFLPLLFLGGALAVCTTGSG